MPNDQRAVAVTETASSRDSFWRRTAPAWTLAVLAPVIAEVLSGATRMSYIFALIPEIMVWGCGALLIREAVRRWRGGWTSMWLLGLALSVAEEFLIQQTSLAPLPWPGTHPAYGRLWGVNWIYFLFMLGYESAFVVLVPIQVTELVFRKRRSGPWLKRFGTVACSLIFLLGCRIAWFAWVKRARPVVFHAPDYPVPAAAIWTGAVIIGLLILLAYALRGTGERTSEASRNAPAVWLVLLGTLVLGFPWYLLMAFVFGPERTLPFWIPVAAGVAWAAIVFAAVKHWASGRGWGDMHRWALTFAAALVCMIAGFAGSSTWPRVDLVGKSVLDVAAVVAFALLARRLGRERSAEA
ncbi:MAG TPA: hypothetical protein VMH00_02810 [Candidatus Limnocylindrales bacterium]|nr:hypothetical protein [Candidatus Limnocylindrales bacterium]